MSLTLAICGIHEVPFYAQSNLTDIVSIGDPAHALCAAQPPPDFTPFPATRVHRFEFQDIAHVAETSPTIEHVKRLLDLIDSLIASKDDVRVLFHCQAGRARSTAAAFILCVKGGMTYQQAYDYCVSIRGQIAPNLLMVKYADQLMGQDGKMIEHIASHHQNTRDWLIRDRAAL